MSINIYGFLDLAEYLREDFNRRKLRNEKYSYRAMAQKLQLSSSTIVRIMNGKRGLSRSMIPRFIQYLGLREREAHYFKNLVIFRSAKSQQVRVAAYRKLAKLRNGRTKTVSQQQYKYYEEWYYTAVRELLRICPFDGDYQALAKKLLPPITVPQARRAVETLIKIGLVEKVESTYVVRDSNISTGETWHGAAISNFQKATAEKAMQALESLAKKDRDFSTMTMCYSRKGFQKVRQLLKRTREELSRIEESDQQKDRVYQINFQAFPLSRSCTGGTQ